jgi:spermidine synthase
VYWRERHAAVAAPAALIPQVASRARSPLLGFGPVLVFAAAGGFISLSYEIFFFHTVSYATGSSATAFATTLAAFLIGLASGSRQAAENARPRRTAARYAAR